MRIGVVIEYASESEHGIHFQGDLDSKQQTVVFSSKGFH